MTRLRAVYFGYYVVAALFIAEIAVTGVSFYSFSIFIREWQHDPALGWSLTAINASFWIGLPLALLSPLMGYGIDRRGPRTMMLVGVPLVGLSFLVQATMTALWQLWLAQGLLVVGQSAAFLGTGKLVGMWFERDRGRMMGIALAGNNAGGIVMGKVVPFMIDRIGWRATLGYFGIGLVVLNSLAIWFLIRDRPEHVLHAAAGRADRQTETMVARSLIAARDEGTGRGWPGLLGMLRMAVTLTARTFREAWGNGMASTAFWLLTITSISTFVSTFAVLNQLGKHLEIVGIGKSTTGTAITLIGFCGLSGKLIFGYASERMPSRFSFGTICLVQIVGILILLLVRADNVTPLLWVFAIIYGVGFGAVGAVQPLVMVETFGLVAFGVVFGALQLLLRVVQASVPYAVGASVDATGSYRFAFIVTLAGLALGAICAIVARPLPQATDERHAARGTAR